MYRISSRGLVMDCIGVTGYRHFLWMRAPHPRKWLVLIHGPSRHIALLSRTHLVRLFFWSRSPFCFGATLSDLSLSFAFFALSMIRQIASKLYYNKYACSAWTQMMRLPAAFCCVGMSELSSGSVHISVKERAMLSNRTDFSCWSIC